MKCAACAKHFAVHSGPEENRHYFNAKVTKEDMEKTYLPAFRALVEEAKVEGVMGAYNCVNGEPACGSPTLQKYLREDWGFEGYFVSDCWAIYDFHEHHYVTKTATESVALALKNGCDLNCGTTYLNMLLALKEGLITEQDIRTAVERLMTTRIKLGMFEHTEYDDIPYEVVACKEHRELALEAARKSMVLLKNDGILPLSTTCKVAVIGPNANSRSVLLGNYSGTPKKFTTVLEGIYEMLGEEKVDYCEGCHLYKDYMENHAMPGDRLSEAVTVASTSDVVILCLGLDAELEGEEGDRSNQYSSGDKRDLQLPSSQQKLLERIVAINKPVVLISMTGSAMNYSYAHKHVNAIVQAWYPGGEGGRAIAELLFGVYNPSGKLPITFYADESDLPPFEDYSMKNRTYRYFTGKPLYPFGYGLSYTTFTYDDVKIRDNHVEVVVTNTGAYDGEEVVQVYSCQCLVAFHRVFLRKGESKTVIFPISPAMQEEILIGGCGFQKDKLERIVL